MVTKSDAYARAGEESGMRPGLAPITEALFRHLSELQSISAHLANAITEGKARLMRTPP